MFQRFSDFLKCTRGNIAFMTAGAAVPLLTLTAGGLEFAEYQRVQVSMQHAADTAVIAAFDADKRGWGKRVQRAHQFFDVNFQHKSRVGRVKKRLRGKQSRQTLVLTYQASSHIKSLFGEFNPFTDDTITVTSRAAQNFNSGQGPRLIPTSNTQGKSQ